MVNHIAAVKAERSASGKVLDADRVFRELFSKTFGQNLKGIRALHGVDWPLAEDLAEALNLRNELAHHFWRRNILKMGTSEGRASLIEQLEGNIKLFHEIDRSLNALTLEIFSRVGVEQETIDALYEQLDSVARGGAVPPGLDLDPY